MSTRQRGCDGQHRRLFEFVPADVFEVASIGMAFASMSGRILCVNAALCTMLGRTREALLKATWQDLTHPDDFEASRVKFSSLAHHRHLHFDFEKRYLRPDGSVVPARVTSDRVTVNGVPMIFSQMRDITGEHETLADLDERLAVQALRDPLTDVPNRIMLLEHLERALNEAGENARVVVALCDLDQFQLFNEAMGHDLGDQLLIAVSRRLGELPGTFTARTGGDEFAIVLTCASGDPRIETFGTEVVAKMQDPLIVDGREITASLAVGLATAASRITVDECLAAALAALHQAKALGHGAWVYSSGDEQAEAIRWLDLTTSLQRAVVDGGIAAYFQPIVDLGSDAIVGFEALARWATPDGTVVRPIEFIPIAERAGLIDALGMSILDQSCQFLRLARAGGYSPDLRVSVNVSPQQLNDPTFPAKVAEVLARHDVPPGSLCLELTESSLVPDDLALFGRLDALKRTGVALAIDDFGTGYSSFAYLTEFPIDVLKLDRACVTDLQDDPRRLAVARSIIGLATTLNISVIAEGIESTDERDTLKRLGCRLGQGFFWSRAVPQQRALAYLGSRVAS